MDQCSLEHVLRIYLSQLRLKKFEPSPLDIIEEELNSKLVNIDTIRHQELGKVSQQIRALKTDEAATLLALRRYLSIALFFLGSTEDPFVLLRFLFIIKVFRFSYCFSLGFL